MYLFSIRMDFEMILHDFGGFESGTILIKKRRLKRLG